MKKTDKEEVAKRILRENDWFRDYYYIKKVIESCCNNLNNDRQYNGLSAVQKARKWGFNLLDSKERDLCNKNPNYEISIENICWKYRDYLRNIYENMFKTIADNLVR